MGLFILKFCEDDVVGSDVVWRGSCFRDMMFGVGWLWFIELIRGIVDVVLCMGCDFVFGGMGILMFGIFLLLVVFGDGGFFKVVGVFVMGMFVL